MNDVPILLVEDNADEVEVALRAMRKAAIDAPIEVARDGQAALERLGVEVSTSGPTLHPRVVFLDLKLPRVDGWEVLRRLREHPATASVPVVVVSSSDDHDDIRRCYELGANSYVVKRMDDGPGRYFAEAAHYWLELNQPPQAKRATP